MAERLGIEVSRGAWRIVDIDDGSPWRRYRAGTRVRAFAVVPPSLTGLNEMFGPVRDRDAAVVVWGVRTDHRQVIVNSGPPESMRREALSALSDAGVDTGDVLAAIVAVGSSAATDGRELVAVALAASQDMREAIAPLVDAGARVRALLTPAAALASLARTRRKAHVDSDGVDVYIALEESLTCIALVRSGAVVAARDLTWGFVTDAGGTPEPRFRDEVALRLEYELMEFLSVIGASTSAIGQVFVCGGLPDLRSMAVRLMERLDVEVEPLDSLFGIDWSQLPEPADEFRERCAELRVAWGAAAAWPPTINLLPAKPPLVPRALLLRAAAVGAIAAVMLIGTRVQESWWRPKRPGLESPTSTANRAAAPVDRNAPTSAPQPGARSQPPSAQSPASPSRPVAPTSPQPAARPPSTSPPPTAASPPPAPALPAVAPPVQPRATAPAPAPSVQSRATPASKAPASAVRSRATPPPPASTPTTTPAAPPATTPARPPAAAQAAPPRTAARGRPAPPAAPSPAPEPFPAALGSILYSPDRKLAIIDGRIVEVGDDVRGARVEDITPTAVILRDRDGRVRRLTITAAR